MSFSQNEAFQKNMTAAMTAAEPEKPRAKPAPYVLYTVNDMHRPPYWRYERVKYILGKGANDQVFISDDDVATRYFYLFCQALNKAKSAEEKYALKDQFPGIQEALRLRKYTSLDTLGLLEGYMLTDVNVDWLSDKFSLAPATAAWYEQLFFDVWSRRDANNWVETEVIRAKEYAGHNDFKPSAAWDRACAYRMFGYHGGLIALELFSTGFLSSDAKPNHRNLAETFIQKALEISISNEGALMGHSRRRLNKTEGEFIKLALDLAAKASQAGNTEIIQNVQRALISVTPLIGEDVKEYLTKLAETDAAAADIMVGAAELRHMDQIKISLGRELPAETKFLMQQLTDTAQS